MLNSGRIMSTPTRPLPVPSIAGPTQPFHRIGETESSRAKVHAPSHHAAERPPRGNAAARRRSSLFIASLVSHSSLQTERDQFDLSNGLDYAGRT